MYFINVFHRIYLYDLSYNKTLYALIMAHIQMQSNQSPLPIVPYPSQSFIVVPNRTEQYQQTFSFTLNSNSTPNEAPAVT